MTEGLRENEPFLLGGWEIHPSLSRMVRGSDVRKLRPQAMDLLTYLVQRRGEVVGNAQMLEELWSGKVVSSASIYVVVSELRHALAEVEEIRVETVPRRGYRLLAPEPRPLPDSRIETRRGSAEPTGENLSRVEGPPGRRRVVSGVGAALAIGITFIAGLVWALLRLSGEKPELAGTDPLVSTSGPGIAVPTIAVLPFRNMSPDPDNAFFAEGVQEEILTILSRLNGLRVISRTSVIRVAEMNASLPEIAERLGATHIVEGSVRRQADNVRITAQLIDAATDQHLWSDNYDRDLQDIFEIQTSVAENIAKAILVRFSVEDYPALASGGTDNLRAYDLYLKARPHPGNLPGIEVDEKVAYLEEALALDPNYVQAWQALTPIRCWNVFWGADPVGEHLSAAEVALGEAKRIAPGTTDTLVAEAWFRYFCQRDFQAALRLVEGARALEPARADFMWLEALLSRRLGDWGSYFRLAEQAVQLDPLHPRMLQDLALWLRNFGHYDESYRYYVQLLRNTPAPDEWLNLEIDLAYVYTSPDYAEWQAVMERYLALGPRPGEARGQSSAHVTVGDYLLLTGRRDAFWGDIEEKDLSYDKFLMGDKYFEVAVLLFLGQDDEARKQARVGLRATVDVENRERELGTWGPQAAENAASVRAFYGGLLGESEVVADALGHLEAAVQTPDHALRRRILLRYIEALLGSDPQKARRLVREADSWLIPPHEFATRPHIWYLLLDDPQIRTRFDDKPEWVQFMRDGWPASRRFPFD
jgi:TolB-like protein/DNA-binding winged helix-turn-helix (wHTH) protein/tetratricopeptide (TPR) repeat protein